MLSAAIVALTAVWFVTGCSGQSNGDDESVIQSPVEGADTDPSPSNELSADGIPVDSLPDPLADDERVDLDSFDLAEYFFTETDRQWFCSVTTAASAFTDQLYVDRFGGAWFERFGQAEWSRHDAFDQLDIVTIAGEQFALREIFGANTLLEFLRHSDDNTDSELYECVLTSRDVGVL